MDRSAKKRAARPLAKNWDKVAARDAGETLAYRDVYETQQLDRSRIKPLQSKTSRVWVAVVASFLAVLGTWIVLSLGVVVASGLSAAVEGAASGTGGSSQGYYASDVVTPAEAKKLGIENPTGGVLECVFALDESGGRLDNICHETKDSIAVPQWYLDQQAASGGSSGSAGIGLGASLSDFSLWKVLLSLLVGALTYLGIYPFLMRNLQAQNLMNDTTDINQYANDQHVALPEEIQRKFDWFPDVGAHSSVQPNSMISHVMLSKKGLKSVAVSRRAEKDLLDADGDIEYLKGEILRDDNDKALVTQKPLIDEAFGAALFDASELPKDKTLRKFYDVSGIPYNPGDKDMLKLKGFNTVGDLINGDWDFPEYETQRPGGAYLVDTSPVNTMVIAMTRAGKGQGYIEPMIDMWMREKLPNNMVINDPKGELLVKNYVRATLRGFQVIQFNLINSMKTDIYNPLGLAADAAREGDATKCAIYVENIADVFFPTDGGEDPVWPNAANNAFKRVAYGMIDYFCEEERELRELAARTDMDPQQLDVKVDEMWGKVTLYNCYQFFVQLSSKKMKNPITELESRFKAGVFNVEGGQELYDAELEKAQLKKELWNGEKEADMLTLYFAATETLPMNTIRTLIANANNALKAMAGSDKMLASVYGIAITAMSFFTDPTISALTSGTPSQNTDLGGLSFPRRVGVRFGMNYLKRDHLIGAQAKWDSYRDAMFTESLGKDFEHEDVVSREGWARYYFKGIYPTDTAYMRLRLVNPQTQMLIRTFYFQFKKSYQSSLNGRYYVTDPVTGKKIVKNGILLELKAVQNAEGETLRYEPGHTVYPQKRLDNVTSVSPEMVIGKAQAIITTMVRYTEAPKAVFLVTPPHLMKYAKLILILLKQLVDLNFDKSYMTKSNQKPLYKTRFMLDELGNLQSEGHGISGFETMLSIGLGQEQQFTLILQTLQQLRDVYGESVDKIVQGNAAGMNTLISTPLGWTRMGDIQVGDEILTPFGTVTMVTGVYPKGIRPVYRVTLRDGSSSEVCHQHLWQVERWTSSITYLGGKDENGKRRDVGSGPGGKTAERVTEIVDTDELKQRVESGQQIDLPRIMPLAYSGSVLPVDPYVLGVILGDGHLDSRNGFVYISKGDSFLIDELRRRGVSVSDYGIAVNGAHKYGIKGIGALMRELGLAGKRAWEKSIPEQYLYGTVQERLDLLRGLMDTDGTVSEKGEMEFCSVSRDLAEGVQALVRSLGGRVGINVKTNVMHTSPKQLTKKAARDAYRVQNIRLQELNPFLLPRKAERWVQRDDNSGNRVVSVEYVRDEQVQCISVADERHLYVMNDYMPTHNTSNIIFLKSTDDSMIDTLQKMSGTKHTAYIDSKTVTKDMERLVMQTEGKVSYTMSVREEPVISYNDLAFISQRNSIVFRAGDSPVWNRNETILPMSWRLFKDTIEHPGHEYTLQTIPTLSSVLDFDVLLNQPDFTKMLGKRIAQAERAPAAKELFRSAYGYSDYDVSRLDPDVYADEVMGLIESMNREDLGLATDGPEVFDQDAYDAAYMISDDEYEDNAEVLAEAARRKEIRDQMTQKIYAGSRISRDMLIKPDGSALKNTLDGEIIGAYKLARPHMEKDLEHFSVGGDGALRSADGQLTYISKTDESEALSELQRAFREEGPRVFAEDDADVDSASISTFKVHPEFYEFLAALDTWQGLARGEFDREMGIQMQVKEA
ncbi:hypothetical protein ANMWB30_23130 [Arthrobacter sp. MWB30]|nr:hypothetical protein ANMWB30_23130 [Arthrobacter sp. MWB30]